MDNFNTSSFDIYKDISARTKGEIYLGVIGAVRTGKSTFIKRFMEQMVLPYMNDEHDRERTIDEMPQSAARKDDHDHRAEIYSKRGGKDPLRG